MGPLTRSQPESHTTFMLNPIRDLCVATLGYSQCTTKWILTLQINQNWNSCCIHEFRFLGRSFHIKLFHLQMCFTKLRMRDDTNLLNSHSTKLKPQPCGAISSTTCKLILLLVWNQGGNKRSNSFKLRTHLPDWGLSSPAHCSSHSSNFGLTRAPVSNNSQEVSKEEQNYPRD